MIEYRKELLDAFEGYPEEVIIKGIEKYTQYPKNRHRFQIYWSKNSKKKLSKYAYEVIEEIKTLIRKKLIKEKMTDVFSNFDEKEVITIFLSLLPKVKNNLLKEYTFEDKLELKEELDELTKTKNYQNINSMRKRLEDHKFLKVKLNDLFSRFAEEDKELVSLIIKTLSEKEQKLLKRRFGENLDNRLPVKLMGTDEMDQINERIIRKIKRLVLEIKSGDKKIIYLNDLFPEYTIEEISVIANKSNTYEKLSQTFGPDLASPTVVPSKYILKKDTVEEIKKLSSYLKGKTQRVRLLTPLYDLLISYMNPEETYEEFVNRVNKIINEKLETKHLEALYERYNKNLLNILNYGQYNPTTSRHDYILTINLIKAILSRDPKSSFTPVSFQNLHKERRYESIFLKFDYGTTIEEIRKELSKEDKNTISLAHKIYGIDLLHPALWGTAEKNEITYIHSKLHKMNIKIQKRKKLEEIKTYMNSEIFLELSSRFSNNLALAIIMWKNYSDLFSLNEISTITDTNELEIIVSYKDYVESKNLKLKN